MARGVAIAGAGMTEMSTRSGRSSTRLAYEAITAALADAGLSLSDVDGLVTYHVDPNGPMVMASMLGLGAVPWYSVTSSGGGGACATIQDAVLAIEAGVAEVVVVYRAENMRSEVRFGEGPGSTPGHSLRHVQTMGLMTPAGWGSLAYHRYLHRYGLENRDLAAVAVSARSWAATNPRSRFFERPLTLEEHQASAWVIEPVLRIPDCCLESDGGAAVVLTSLDRARQGRAEPVVVAAAARGMGAGTSLMQNYYRDDITGLPDLEVVADQLWRATGLSAADVDAAILYDSFSPLVPMALETFGWCKPGEGIGMIAAGETGPGGAHPINMNGGQLGEGYLHGFNGIVEAVRQFRGVAANQVPVDTMLVCSGPALPTSGMVLQRA